MKLAQDCPSAAEMQPPSQESQGNQQNNGGIEPHVADSNSISVSNSDNRKVSREDIELVQNLIERCLQLYMNKGEVVRTLSNRARIEPSFTTLVNNLPMGYPVMQQAQMPTAAQPNLDSIGCGLSSCHVVNGIPAPAGFQPIQMNSGNETFEAVAAAAPCSVVSTATEMAVSPASAASSNHFPFAPSELSGMGMDTSALDPAFTSNLETAGGLPDGGVDLSRDSIRSLGQLWNFSLSDLTADLTNLGDLGPLGDYTGSPFLPSDSDILLDSPEQDDIVEDFFADTNNNGPCSQSDEEKT